MKPRICVVMNTLNEEHNLPMVLRSVQGWVDDIVVVDMHSDDQTAEVARRFGARVFPHERLGFADPARAYALAQATGDWVLMLDADEVVPPALAQSLQRLALNPQIDAVDIPYQNFVGGVPVRGLGWGPEQDHHIRFFRRGAMYSTGEIHNFLHLSARARVRRLRYDGRNAILHFSYTDYGSVVAKINRYTDLEAANKLRKGGRPSTVREVLLPLREFLMTYVLKKGYRDGRLGLRISVLLAFYKYLREIKLSEKDQSGSAEEIRDRYRKLAEVAMGGGTVE